MNINENQNAHFIVYILATREVNCGLYEPYIKKFEDIGRKKYEGYEKQR